MELMNQEPSPRDEVFEAHRAYLRGAAYRMLGLVADAEDMVQETYLRWHKARGVTHPKAYLTKVLVRLCLDQLKSARARRETYVGPWLPEPVLSDPSPDEEIQLSDDVSFALLLTLERLSPLERAAFLLHDVFGLSFQEVSGTLSRSETTCRQLASRARSHVRRGGRRFRPSRKTSEGLRSAFLEAARSGDASKLARLLKSDVVFVSDGGGVVPSALRPVQGRDKVVRLILGLGYKIPPDAAVELHFVNGLPGFLLRAGKEWIQTVALEVGTRSRVSRIYVVSNPNKLRHLATK
jgi:RNA polymerase sigma-70 factor (ECF subfamily)